jgi:pterin-4a-carbinolamine dehydratase
MAQQAVHAWLVLCSCQEIARAMPCTNFLEALLFDCETASAAFMMGVAGATHKPLWIFWWAREAAWAVMTFWGGSHRYA